MSAQAIGLGNGAQVPHRAPTGRPYLARAWRVVTLSLRRQIRAAPLGLESDTGGSRPRATLRLPWADFGLRCYHCWQLPEL